jgi:DegV family protein with EDD domain
MGDLMIKIVTDSSSDISKSEAKKLGIILVPLQVSFGETNYLDGVDLTTEEFYDKLEVSKVSPKTSQISSAVYENLFEDAKKNGDTLIMMTLSQKISGSHSAGIVFKNNGGYENIYFYDTLASVGMLKNLVLEAVKYKDEMDIETLFKHLDDIRDRSGVIVLVDTLEYLYKGGRLSKTSAIIGTILKIKPIVGLICGEVKMLSKHLGIKSAIQALKDKLDSFKIDKSYPLYFQYGNDPENIEKLIDLISDEPAKDKKKIFRIGPTIGTHLGPGAAMISAVFKTKLKEQ